MKEYAFKKATDWIGFSLYIRETNRFCLDANSKKFVNAIIETARKRERKLKWGEEFYRARLGCKQVQEKKMVVISENRPYSKKDMLRSSLELVKEGRINPKGISYLYLSSSPESAVAEIRPYVGQFVCVIKCKIFGHRKIVDLTSLADLDIHTRFKKRHSQLEKENIIWYQIQEDFSKPILDHAINVDHTPTQYIAERLKNVGYDGIAYRSSLSKKGYNIVFFNSWHVLPNGNVRLYKVSSVDYLIEPQKTITLRYLNRRLNLSKIGTKKNLYRKEG